MPNITTNHATTYTYTTRDITSSCYCIQSRDNLSRDLQHPGFKQINSQPMPGSRSLQTGGKKKRTVKNAQEHQGTASDPPSPAFTRFFTLFFFDFLPSSNRLIDSLCGRVGSGWGERGLGVQREILLPFFLPPALPLQMPADYVLRRLADGHVNTRQRFSF